MKFKVYKVLAVDNDQGIIEIWDVGVYPTLKEAQDAALKEIEFDEKDLKKFFGFKTVIVDKENYTVKFINAAGHWRVWWYGAEQIKE